MPGNSWRESPTPTPSSISERETRFTADVLTDSPQLWLISIWGTGSDHVDLDAAQARGIGVS